MGSHNGTMHSKARIQEQTPLDTVECTFRMCKFCLARYLLEWNLALSHPPGGS